MSTVNKNSLVRNGLTSLNPTHTYPFTIELEPVITFLLNGVIRSLQTLGYRQRPYSIDSLTLVGIGYQGEDLGKHLISLSPTVLRESGIIAQYAGTIRPQVQNSSKLLQVLDGVDIYKTAILLTDDADRGNDRTADMELAYNEFYNNLRKEGIRGRWFYPKIIRVSYFGLSNNGSSSSLRDYQIALNVHPHETFRLLEYILSRFYTPSKKDLLFGLLGVGDSGSSIANEIYRRRQEFKSSDLRIIASGLDSPINLWEDQDKFFVYDVTTGEEENFDEDFLKRRLKRYRGIGIIDDVAYTGKSLMKIKSIYDRINGQDLCPIVFSPIINFTNNPSINAPINFRVR